MAALVEVEAEAEAMAWATRNHTGGTAGAGSGVRYPLKLYQVGMQRCVGRLVEGGTIKVVRWLHNREDEHIQDPFTEEELFQRWDD